ncbi:unnamed protein product [Closterium sp. NIES-53]
MADYISEIRNIHEELKDIGITFPEQARAAGLLVGLTPAYNVTSSMLKQLPTKELTFEKVASALLSAEKDLAAQASVNAVRYSPGIPFRSQQGQRRNSFPPCQYLIRKGPRSMLFHHRLGHINFRALSDLATKQLLHGLPASLPQTPSLSGPPCLDCA